MRKPRRNLIGIFGPLTIVFMVTKCMGFVKQMVNASVFGTSLKTDLISLSEGFILNVEYAMVQAMSTAFVTSYIHIKSEDENQGKRFISDSIKLFSGLSVLIAGIIVLASPVVAKILAPSYEPELSRQLSNYINVFSPVFVLIVVRAVFQAVLNSNEQYIPGEMTALIQSVATIALVCTISVYYGVDTLVIASYASCLLNLFYLVLRSRRYTHLERGNPFSNSNIKEMLIMMVPLLLGYSMVFINQQVDKVIVSGLGEGTITAMHYGQVLSNLVCALITAFCTVIFTRLTKYLSEANDREAANYVSTACAVFVVALIPISIITVICSKDIVGIAFGRGGFNSSDVKKASLALSGYGLMFPFYAVKGLFSRFQYGMKNTNTPMINNSIGICCNIVLSIVLSKFIGLLGVTIASSVAEGVSAVLNYRSAKKQNRFICLDHRIRRLIPFIVLGMAICIFGCCYLNSILTAYSSIIRFGIITVLSLAAYSLVVGAPLYKSVKTGSV